MLQRERDIELPGLLTLVIISSLPGVRKQLVICANFVSQGISSIPFGVPECGQILFICSFLWLQVIFDVLRKVNAIDEPSRFALFVVKDSGEVRRLRDDESPLYKRLQLGPKEDLAKLWIMEATETASVSLSAEVAQYYNLSMAFLQKIVERFEEEEERLVSQVRQKFNLEREVIIELLDVMEADVDEPDGDGGSLV